MISDAEQLKDCATRKKSVCVLNSKIVFCELPLATKQEEVQLSVDSSEQATVWEERKRNF